MTKQKIFFNVSLAFVLTFFVTVNTQASNYEVHEFSITIEEVTNSNDAIGIIDNIEGITVLSTYENTENLYYKLLIPVSKFDEFTEKVSNLGKVTHKATSQTNITNSIIEVETNIKNKTEHKNIIMEMINQADDLNTILDLERHLINVEVNQTTDQNMLYNLKNSVENIQVTLDIYIKPEETPPAKSSFTFGERLKNNFINSYSGTVLFIQNFIISLSYFFIPIIFVSCFGILIFKILKKGGKKNEEK